MDNINNDYGFAFNALIIKYIPENVNTYIELKKALKNNFSFLFFRFFYFFHVLIKYIYKIKNNKDNKELIKEIYLNFLNHSKKSSKHILTNELINDLNTKFNYLYKTFFIDNNIYFTTYFNNLIKYFLPVPYPIMQFSPVITFRNNVTKLFKKDDIDYLDKINNIDRLFTTRYVKKKNIDKIKYEIDMHLPIKYFDPTLFDKNNIFLIASKKENYFNLQIMVNVKLNNNVVTGKLLFNRKFDQYNEDIYKKGFCYEALSELWLDKDKNKEDINDGVDDGETSIAKDLSDIGILNRLWKINKEVINVDIDDVVYISILRKIKEGDLFNVFGTVDFLTKDYNNLFHNTSLDIDKEKFNDLLQYPTFFSLTPFLSIPKFFKGRKCLNYEIKKDITQLLDLTNTIISNNVFINEPNNNKFKYYDNLKIMNHYQNKEIPQKEHSNNNCLSNEVMSIKDFIKNRPYCDINDAIFYVGRRKLQEILYKTRKYDASKIWVYDHHKEIYEKYGYEWDDNKMYTSIYHSPYKKKTHLIVSNYDTMVLKDIGVTGFFFTDFSVGFATGGEIMLTKPNVNVKINGWKEHTCDVIEPFKNFKEDIKMGRSQNKNNDNYAYVALLMGNTNYFYGAMVLGYSLKKVNSKYDTIIMVTPDVPKEQIIELKKYYKIVNVNYVDIDTGIIKNYEKSRFKDVFTKFQCFKLIEYKKILMIDIDMLVLKNMDHLFNLEAPAACLRRHDLKHGQKIDERYIVKNKKLIGGINAGLMLLTPNIDEYNFMLLDIKTNKNNDMQFKNPEQDYLSYHYSDILTNISFIYNYQVGLLDRSKKYKFRDVYNIHYSSRLKPWLPLNTNKDKIEETEKWIDETPFIKPFYGIWIKYYNKL
jgi:hypothetical protein